MKVQDKKGCHPASFFYSVMMELPTPLSFLLFKDCICIGIQEECCIMLALGSSGRGCDGLCTIRVLGNHCGTGEQGIILNQRLFTGALMFERTLCTGRKVIVGTNLTLIMNVADFRGNCVFCEVLRSDAS